MDKIERAKLGTIVPIVKTLDKAEDPINLFAKLSDYGRKKNCILLESADIVDKYGELSIGTANPCLKISGNKEDFEIIALNKKGEIFLKEIKDDFKFCDKAVYKKNMIKGKLARKRRTVSEDERLKLKTHMDILRTIAFKFKPTEQPFIPYCGLFGAISYDFIDQFEDLPMNKNDPLGDPDYEMYFVDNLFLIDHKADKTHIIVNALITNQKRKEIISDVETTIKNYEKAIDGKMPTVKKKPVKAKDIKSDTSKEEFIQIIEKLKQNVVNGDVFQVVPSRTISMAYNAEPLDIYHKLKNLNPSPYMFYINNGNGILLGSSPEMFLRVQGNEEKIVEIRPIAGTKPRGIVEGKLDHDLDSRYEAELKIDQKELAEHTMLIDLARNDVAKVSKPGTRYVDEPFIVEKYSHVQHLVSNVRGVLKDDLDALHAYMATMNMGTLTGAPKIEAMKLIREVEKNKRGFYGGSVGYLTPSGDFDSCIVIRSMRLKGGKAYVRAGAGIVYDSIPESEFSETEKKAKACVSAVEQAGGLK
ncbi:MAG: anthranilate synthase component 1 [Nanoarchaeota archaeon]|nr:anthranilate synthase component 1 [Nanoarchaeota archaeon]